jgi:uncharacterized protein
MPGCYTARIRREAVDVSDVQLPSWSEVRAAIDTLGLAMTPAELHGAVSGWFAGGGADTPDWLARVLADDSVPPVPRDNVLDAVRAASLDQLGNCTSDTSAASLRMRAV